MLRVLFPGTFDPPTNGHRNIIKRASLIFDKLDVVVAVNTEKKNLFSPEERAEMLGEMVRDLPGVEVHIWDKLIVEFARRHDAKLILRGVRALTDFSYEFEVAMTNQSLDPGIEIVFMPTDPKYFVIRSSIVREVFKMNGDISRMVPPVVEEALRRKFGKSGLPAG
ncbi:MAG: pantetheine-phosphate adenylyltransferase [Spirochaetales bacterium]|nr:pantetheine-phosphate adenylyltransferase [Spirochaetales bacterium]